MLSDIKKTSMFNNRIYQYSFSKSLTYYDDIIYSCRNARNKSLNKYNFNINLKIISYDE